MEYFEQLRAVAGSNFRNFREEMMCCETLLYFQRPRSPGEVDSEHPTSATAGPNREISQCVGYAIDVMIPLLHARKNCPV